MGNTAVALNTIIFKEFKIVNTEQVLLDNLRFEGQALQLVQAEGYDRAESVESLDSKLRLILIFLKSLNQLGC